MSTRNHIYIKNDKKREFLCETIEKLYRNKNHRKFPMVVSTVPRSVIDRII